MARAGVIRSARSSRTGKQRLFIYVSKRSTQRHRKSRESRQSNRGCPANDARQIEWAVQPAKRLSPNSNATPRSREYSRKVTCHAALRPPDVSPPASNRPPFSPRRCASLQRSATLSFRRQAREPKTHACRVNSKGDRGRCSTGEGSQAEPCRKEEMVFKRRI
jgi:hypothetical protein